MIYLGCFSHKQSQGKSQGNLSKSKTQFENPIGESDFRTAWGGERAHIPGG